MRILSPALIALVLLVPAGLTADVIVLTDGRVFEIEGPIRFEGDFVHFQLKTGQDVMFRRFEVDENKTRGLNKVLDSDTHGLRRLRQVEKIEGQRSRTVGRSIPMVEERPPLQEIKEVAKEREPRDYGPRSYAGYPAGDYPITLQADRVSRETIGREAAEERVAAREAAEAESRSVSLAREREEAEAERAAQREEKRQEKAAAREAREAAWEAERREREEARALRKAEREAERAQRETEHEPAAPERRVEAAEPAAKPAGEDPRAESYRERIVTLDEQIDETRTELRRLTDLQKDAEAEFEGQRLRSVDEEIDRLLHRIDRLESRKKRLQTRLLQFESQ